MTTSRRSPPLPPEPSYTKLDIRGTIVGNPLRIHPWFWVAVLLLGIRYIADPEHGSIGYLSFWVAAALACVLLHALAQAGVTRWFGHRCGILLYLFGSLLVGLETVPRCRQRVCILLAGPLVQLLIVAAVWGITILPFPGFLAAWGWQDAVANGLFMLLDLNLYWGILNLLPVWPLAGGRIAADLGNSLLGSGGPSAAMALSLATIALISIGVVFQTGVRLNNRFDPRYPMYLSEGLVQLLFCFLLWLQSFKAMLAPSP